MAARDWRDDPIGATGNEGVIEVKAEKTFSENRLFEPSIVARAGDMGKD